MSKKTLLNFVFLFLSVMACYSQSKESLGDKAMASGDYATAVIQYKSAMETNPSKQVAEKLNLATILKAEFEAIDEAIENRDADMMEIHVANVLMADPNNKFVDAKMKQIPGKLSLTQPNSFKSIFMGDEHRHQYYGLLRDEMGICLLTTPLDNSLNIGFHKQYSYRHFKSFPFFIEFTTLSHDHGRLLALGGGSCLFLSDHLTLDYAGGYQLGKMDYNGNVRKGGYYYRVGMSYLWDPGLGFSYSYNLYNDHVVPFHSHQFSVSFSLMGRTAMPITSCMLVLYALIYSGIEIFTIIR